MIVDSGLEGDPMKGVAHLAELIGKTKLLVLGLMSAMSADGVDLGDLAV